MLLGNTASKIRPVAVLSRNPLLARLLASILNDWKFTVVEEVAEAKVVFIERGMPLPEPCVAEVVWLSPMPLSQERFLLTPLSLTELYGSLEEFFFPVPRRHIRITTEVAAEIKYDGRWRKGQLLSLSDRGGRLSCDAELLKQTALTLEIKLPGRLLRTDAEVLYCVAASDIPGRQQPQIGVLFKPLAQGLVEALRRFIEKHNIESACEREGIALHDPCLSWLNFAENPWQGLA
ncbi:MAG: PilZ domain-containing protein [Desulfuromonadales bacterium]|nr:PilZ domain-containing protein [Desulfuromonadales bacterium]